MANPKYFDTNTIADMVGEENVAVMLQHYLDAGYPWLEEFKAEWLAQNDQQIKLLAHKMKSSSRIIGAMELANQLEYIEKCIYNKDTKVMHDQQRYESLVDSFTELFREVNEYLN